VGRCRVPSWRLGKFLPQHSPRRREARGETPSSGPETISLPAEGDDPAIEPLTTLGERLKRAASREQGQVGAYEAVRWLG